jgi:hypothetical protein
MRRLESVRTGLKNTSPGRRRFLCHLLGLLLLLPGRATFRNLSRYSVYHEKTFRRWCAQDFDWVSVNRAAIMQVIPAAHEHVLAFDPAWCLRVGRVSSHWREMRACNDNACGESKSQNSPEKGSGHFRVHAQHDMSTEMGSVANSAQGAMKGQLPLFK